MCGLFRENKVVLLGITLIKNGSDIISIGYISLCYGITHTVWRSNLDLTLVLGCLDIDRRQSSQLALSISVGCEKRDHDWLLRVREKEIRLAPTL